MIKKFLLIPFALSFVFAQEGAIKFQIPLDSAGMPTAPPPKPEPQKPVATQNTPLNLAELSAKDTASFETYSKRRALVQDSITATQREIENVKKKTLSFMPVLEPKGEFEKQVEFDARKAKWEKELEEKTKRDSKSLSDRLAELEKAFKKIGDNQAVLYSSIDIKTSPEAASIWLNKEEIGATPAKYELALPGYTVIRIQKENYEPWDTTFTLQPAQKIKINVALQEKSIFSREEELDFPKILAKDTTVEGYRKRIKRVDARSGQIDGEIKIILENFSNTYPALEPQKPNETLQDFERRKSVWTNEGTRQYAVLMKKHEAYKSKLMRTIKVLEDNIIAAESQFITEAPLNTLVALGAYDADKEVFEIEAFDTLSNKSPFHFVGTVGIPRDTAKIMNRSLEGFLVSISYLNYPFVFGDSSFNLAMKELSLSRKAVPLKVEGAFKPIGRFEAMEGYGAWRARADSILSGHLKVQGLGLDYALKGGGEATDLAGSGGLGWRGWTRILTFTATAALGTLAVVKHLDAEDAKKKIKNIDPYKSDTDKAAWFKQKKNVEDSESSRNMFSIGTGVFAVGGILTFVF